jgi:GntR family transcriptional regulator, rspAB operon transcriptional repressor
MRRLTSPDAQTGHGPKKPSSVPRVGQQFQSLSQQVYAALLNAIAHRSIRPGERLRLDRLAAELGVSRTPIRDALSRLAAEGLVQPAGRTALRVTQLGTQDLAHLYDLRLMCELYALDKGFGEITPGLIGQLERCSAELVRMGRSVDPDSRVAMALADRQFHLLLVGLAGNPQLNELYSRLNIHIHGIRVGPSPMLPRARGSVNAREHNAIIQALRAKDLAAAREALSSHIRSGMARALASLRLVSSEAEAEGGPAVARPGARGRRAAKTPHRTEET